MNRRKPSFHVDKRKCVFRLFYLFFLSILFLPGSRANNNRIVGYLPYYRFHLVDQMELERLTHLVIAFGHPDEQGKVEVPRVDIWPVTKKAKDMGVKVLLSLGGGALHPEDEKYWKYYLKPGHRSLFIRNIVQFLQGYELDGVDIDLEWQYINEQYSGFIVELERALRPHGMLLTAALPPTTRYKHLTDEALGAFDFVNLMVYDLTGPSRPDRPGQHSPFSLAVNAIDFWRKQGLPSERMTLGLPLFGWNFSMQDTVSSVTYRELVAMDASFAQLDQVGKIYYNGLSMIRAKTQLAISEVSGVMLWELGQDAFNELSLLRAVYEVMYPVVEKESEKEQTPAISRYSPEAVIASTHATILGGDQRSRDLFLLERRQGRLTVLRKRDGQDLMILPVPNYPPAFYFSADQAYEVLRNR